MSRLLVTGREKLDGEVYVQGAKNSALPLLAATILTKGENIIFNCPELSDVEASLLILRYLGCGVKRSGKTIIVKSDNVSRFDIPDDLMRKTRSSIVFLGAIIARTGKAKLSFPGGCEIGPRPIDLHLKALREMGAIIEEKHGYLECFAPKGLNGAKIVLSFPSVGATEDIIIAACLANGTTTITNAAREPEICDLAEYLNKCGAKIYGAGEGVVVIDGVTALEGTQHTIIPDRIAAATFMACAAVTGSHVTLDGIVSSHLASIIPIFEESGCKIKSGGGRLDIFAPKRLKSMRIVRTMPYPGFPTDAQAPLLAAACTAQGTSIFVENIFENRYRHIGELVRMGANIKTEGKVAVVEGADALYGAAVEATDLRGAAALAVAGLCAEGTTSIGGVQFLERGYEDFEVVLSSLGADIKKI
ncbi:MAG: UDP-N-acetylglucosamine 1-carboxyvinyltransferase [Clostridiales bacterium]|nr:UDP-N-acetylglucosamine 1-carboxyvinyltransferase [Clostridiales bacterium]